ncbi:MAG: hypothetical protein QFX33_01115 [Candidatus Nezhaarchaeota archaeon]|nr:hypothetical protein [Candidatus Nezhaarchaeota archaeon]
MSLLLEVLRRGIDGAITTLDKQIKIHALIEQVVNNNRGCLVIGKPAINSHEIVERITHIGGRVVEEFTYSAGEGSSLSTCKVTICELMEKTVELGLMDNKLSVVWYRKDGNGNVEAITVKNA